MTTNERYVLFLTMMSHGLCHVFVLIFPAVLGLLVQHFMPGPTPEGLSRMVLFGLGEGSVFSRELWGGYSILTVVGTVGYAAFGFFAVPWGWLVDRLGPVRVIRIFILGAGLSMGLIAVSPSLVMLAVGMFCLGLFAGAYHPSGLSLISLAVTERGRAMGYHGMAGNLGLGLAPFLAASVAAALDWRWTYGVFALVALTLGLASFLLPIRVERRPQSVNPGPGPNPAGWRSLVAPALLILFGVAIFNGLAYRGAMTFLPTLFESNFRYSLFGLNNLAQAGMLATIVLLVGIAGQYTSGRLIDRVGGERIVLAAAALGLPFLFLMALTTNLWLMAVSLGFAFFHFATQPAGNYLLSVYTPDEKRGLGYGVYFSMIFGMGSAGAALSGWLFDWWGFEVLFITLSGLFAMAGLLALCLVLRRGRAARGAARPDKG
ncbi:MAG: MFS transporter [Proteobacteria bacterium]|nr:MFS transporter [Pseudomonadota bacterium]MBU1741903.1 MFS transporter [Pseudomonadota bacterium]